MQLLLAFAVANARNDPPPASDRSWAPPGLPKYEAELAERSFNKTEGGANISINPRKVYGLAELIEIAAPDTDLDNVRNRVVGILLGLVVTGLVFQHIWPERTIDRLRAALRAALQQLARLVEIPRPESSIEAAKADARRLIGETSKSFDQARRYIELTQFEFEESPNGERTSLGNLETTLARAKHVFTLATSLTSDSAWDEWRRHGEPRRHRCAAKL